MNDLITLSCPSCGATLEATSGAQQISCEYCGNTHILVETLTDESSSKARHKRNLAQGRLMTFFDFNIMDLEYNRNGKLSPYQERRFFGVGLSSFLLFFVGGVMGAIASLIVSPFGEPYFCATLSVMASMIFGLISYRQLMKPVEAGVVQSKIGTLGKSPHSIWKPVFYIGNESFPAKDNPFTVLEWNVPYKVYYTPAKHIVLSIELLNS